MSNNNRVPVLKPALDCDYVEALRLLVEKRPALVAEVNENLQMISAMREKTSASVRMVTKVNESLMPEQVQYFLSALKGRFNEYMQFHEGVNWFDVEKSLCADPEAMQKLYALDNCGHSMNVFGENNDEFIFVSAWRDYRRLREDHRSIVYDQSAQEEVAKNDMGECCNGNAVGIAESLGVELADLEFHELLRKVYTINGYAWFKTDAVTRKSGFANLDCYSICKYGVGLHDSDVSFRALLKVKKV